MKKLLSIVLLLAAVSTTFGQWQLHIGNDYFRELKYQKAIKLYINAIKRKPTLEATEKLADCYRYTNNYSRAEFWYGKAITYPGASPKCFYQYGQMLKVNQKYEQAKGVFEKYARLSGVDVVFAQTLINSCDSAMIWNNEPKDYLIASREDLNSSYSDFGVAKLAEYAIVFTSNRTFSKKDFKKSDDQDQPYYNLVFSQLDEAGSATSVEPFSFETPTPYHIATPSFTENFDTLFFTRSFVDKGFKESVNRLEIFFSVRKDTLWSKPTALPINKSNVSMGHPYWDASSKTLYFVSNEANGLGGYDIWFSTLNGGVWSKPLNAGKTLNTPEDEFYPVVKNGQMFFSSKGHAGLGGFDIFQSSINADGQWSRPENLKAPLNTSFDDFSIYYDRTDNKGLLSSNRNGQQGSDDIFTFEYTAPLGNRYFLDVRSVVVKAGERYALNGAEVKINRIGLEGLFLDTVSVNGNTYYEIDGDSDYELSVAYPDCFSFDGIINLNTVTPIDTFRLNASLPRQDGVILETVVELKSKEIGAEYQVENIYFDYNKSEIRPDAEEGLSKLITVLQNNPEIKIELGSYCDSRGDSEYNQRLSERRAKSVLKYLVNKGIKRNRLTSKGYGESSLVNECFDGVECSEEEHQQNRRTMFKIVGN